MRTLLSILSLLTSCAWGALKFDAQLVEAHTEVGAEQVTIDFHFVNDGKESVVITGIKRDCDCIDIQASGGTKLPGKRFRYKPGEKGTIRTIFEIGNNEGVVDQNILIWLQGDPKEKPSSAVTARIHITQLIEVSTKTLKWEIGAKAEPKAIEVTLNAKQPVKITDVTSTSDEFGLEVRAVEEGKRYELLVTPKNTHIPGMAAIRIVTDSDMEGHNSRQVFAMVHRP